MNRDMNPSVELLDIYGLKNEYGDIVKAVVLGDLGALEKALLERQDVFLRSGVFVLMERLRYVTLRNFVKRVANAVKSDPSLQINENKPYQIDLRLILEPLKQGWDTEMDLDDLEFQLSNLFSSQMINGTIEH